jgi:hypothetical protein
VEKAIFSIEIRKHLYTNSNIWTLRGQSGYQHMKWFPPGTEPKKSYASSTASPLVGIRRVAGQQEKQMKNN